jgi:hypothetical protein
MSVEFRRSLLNYVPIPVFSVQQCGNEVGGEVGR